MRLVFHIFPMAKALQGSVMSVARGLWFLRLKGHLLFPDAQDVAVASSRKTVLSDLCPAFCCAGGISWQDEATLFSFRSLTGVAVCALILTCVCMG